MSVTYYTASGQTAWNAAVTVGLPVWDRVIPIPNDTVCFRQRFMQTAASYAPLALDTPYPAAGSYGVPTASTYYLVDETNFNDRSGGVIEWDRVYCCVPTSWSEPEEFAFNYPGFFGSAASTYFTATGLTLSGSSVVIATSATGISAGDSVYFSITYARGSTSGYLAAMTVKCSAASAGASVTVPDVFPGSGAFGTASGTIRKAQAARGLAKTFAVGSRLIHDYAYSTVASLDTTLPIIEVFTPTDISGFNDVTILSAATIPTGVSYATLVQNNSEIVGETSVRRRFMGNIYVRSTRMIPAR